MLGTLERDDRQRLVFAPNQEERYGTGIVLESLEVAFPPAIVMEETPALQLLE
ncbi:MAG TPA: hypothetical protein VN664_01800 [Burkholderiales bacterium]|nr:hypothetical protein [Burkholderiales bacterium]